MHGLVVASRATNSIQPYWTFYVLERSLAEIIKREVGLAPDLIEGAAGKIDPTRFAFTLDPRRDVNAVAKDIVAVDDDVADIDADTKVDLYYSAFVPFGHLTLHGRRTDYGIYDACELDQHAIASSLDDPTIVLGDSGINDFAAVRLQRRKGADFVNSHEPRITYDIRRQYRRQSSLDTPFCHEAPPDQLVWGSKHKDRFAASEVVARGMIIVHNASAKEIARHG
jgi:hypothetical protein